MSKTNCDVFLEEQLRDPDFAERFKQAGKAWDVALQITELREKADLSQKNLARKLKTSQQLLKPRSSRREVAHSVPKEVQSLLTSAATRCLGRKD